MTAKATVTLTGGNRLESDGVSVTGLPSISDQFGYFTLMDPTASALFPLIFLETSFGESSSHRPDPDTLDS